MMQEPTEQEYEFARILHLVNTLEIKGTQTFLITASTVVSIQQRLSELEAECKCMRDVVLEVTELKSKLRDSYLREKASSDELAVLKMSMNQEPLGFVIYG